MFNEEQLKELKEDGLTDEQIEILEDAFALKETIDMLPDDIESFVRKYDSQVPGDVANGMRATFELAKTDPEFFQQIVAMQVALSENSEEQSSEPEKTFVTELPQKEYETASKNFFNTLVNLSEEDRVEFLRLIANITPEQKKDMVSRLIKD